MIPNFKEKSFHSLTVVEKTAFAERVCMDLADYLKNVLPNSAGLNFARYWKSKILTVMPSDSPYLAPYYYIEGEGLCVHDGSVLLSVKYNPKEVINFIQNVVSHAPFRSPIADAILRGTKIPEIKERGILEDSYGSAMPKMKGTKGLKVRGKPINPNSLYQKIKRGEMTRYEAYQKKTEESL